MTVLDVIGRGHASALRKTDIAARLGCSTREVEAAIQQARLDGAPICSDEHGYWLGSAAEVAECADRLRHRYINQALTARALRRTAQRMAERHELTLGATAHGG